MKTTVGELKKLIREALGDADHGYVDMKELEEWCDQVGWPRPEFKMYRRTIHAYWFENAPGMSREEMEEELESIGGNVDRQWNEGGEGASITNVSYV